MTAHWPGRSWMSWVAVWIVCLGATRLLFKLGHRWRRDPTFDRIPATGPILYVANHQSHYDPPLISNQVRNRPCGFLARASLFRNRWFGGLIRFLGAVPLDVSGRGAKAFRAAIEELEAGRGVLVFPEGARSEDGAMHDFQPGIMLLVRRAKPTIVPVAVEGVYDAYPRGGKPRFGVPIATRVGHPIAAEELLALDTASALDRMRREIETMRLELREELRARTKGRIPAPGPGDVPWWERDAAEADAAAVDADAGAGTGATDEGAADAAAAKAGTASDAAPDKADSGEAPDSVTPSGT